MEPGTVLALGVSASSLVISAYATMVTRSVAKETRLWQEKQNEKKVLWEELRYKKNTLLEFCAHDFYVGNYRGRRVYIRALDKVSMAFGTSPLVQDIISKAHKAKVGWDAKEIGDINNDLNLAMVDVILQDERVLREIPDAKIHSGSDYEERRQECLEDKGETNG